MRHYRLARLRTVAPYPAVNGLVVGHLYRVQYVADAGFHDDSPSWYVYRDIRRLSRNHNYRINVPWEISDKIFLTYFDLIPDKPTRWQRIKGWFR